MREDEKTPFDDEFIRKRLKTKMRASALIYVFGAIFILGLVLFIVFVVTYGMNVLTFIQSIVLIACTVLLVLEIVKHVKQSRQSKVSNGSFTVTEDTVLHKEQRELHTRYGGYSYEYTLTLARHNNFVTRNSELIGAYSEENEKCYVVSYDGFPDDAELVFSKRIYRYTGNCMK